MKVLNNLKQIRQERGLSLRELARCSGIDYTTINKIENGYISPTQITMMSISKGLNMKTEDVFILNYK